MLLRDHHERPAPTLETLPDMPAQSVLQLAEERKHLILGIFDSKTQHLRTHTSSDCVLPCSSALRHPASPQWLTGLWKYR